jgi:hypothetical protein
MAKPTRMNPDVRQGGRMLRVVCRILSIGGNQVDGPVEVSRTTAGVVVETAPIVGAQEGQPLVGAQPGEQPC